jgi:hypothetical protein
MCGTASRIVWNAAERFTARPSSHVTHHGVVDHDVQRTERGRGRRDQRFDLLWLSEIGTMIEGSDLVRALDPGAVRFDVGLRLEIGERDVAAVGGQPLGHGQAEAAGRSRDEGAPVIQWSDHDGLMVMSRLWSITCCMVRHAGAIEDDVDTGARAKERTWL